MPDDERLSFEPLSPSLVGPLEVSRCCHAPTWLGHPVDGGVKDFRRFCKCCGLQTKVLTGNWPLGLIWEARADPLCAREILVPNLDLEPVVLVPEYLDEEEPPPLPKLRKPKVRPVLPAIPEPQAALF